MDDVRKMKNLTDKEAAELGNRLWIARDGRQYRWFQMTCEHLDHTTRMLSRKAIEMTTVMSLGLPERKDPDQIAELSQMADQMWAYMQWKLRNEK